MGDSAGQLLEIRPFRESDEASVVALWHAVFPDDPPWNEPTLVVQRKLAVQRDLFLVAIQRDRLVGTALAGFDGFRGWVYHLAITPDERGHGFGRSLMREVEERLRTRGCPKLNLQVRAANRDVVAFYLDLGYSVEEHVSMGKRLV